MAVTGEEMLNLRQLKLSIEEKKKESFSPIDAWPVGSVYISVNGTSPSMLFGGTWVEIQGSFLFARNASHPAGESGGEETHTLTVQEMPSHSHSTTASRYASGRYLYLTPLKVPAPATGYTTSTGGSQPHNNMPPYLSVYMWKRTA